MERQPLPEFINGFRTIKDLGNKGNRRYLIAECKVCKNHFRVEKENLKSIKVSSCGCKRKYRSPKGKLIGIPQHLRSIYSGIKGRCYNKNNEGYKNYGAKGIKICKEWKVNNRIFFQWAIDNGYKVGLILNRINPLLGYNPKNCKFMRNNNRGQVHD